MKKHLIAIGGSLATLAFSATAEESGRRLFTSSKCQQCHTIRTLGLHQQKGTGTEEAENEQEEKKDEVKPADLSGVGRKHDAAWIQKYLAKKVSQDGKRHKPRFKGAQRWGPECSVMRFVRSAIGR